MKREICVSLLLLAACALVSCSRSSQDSPVATGNKNQSVNSEKPLAGVAEVVHSFGDLIPANPDMVRLMKLPISREGGNYKARQLILESKPDDVRGIYVGDKDTDNIILGRVDTRRDSFEKLFYLTSPRGELRCIVYSPLGSREQRLVNPGNPVYEKAVKDFEDQVRFWINMEQELRVKFRDKGARQ